MPTNERAVSPVIGVVLMVAITVVLAGVIAAFVIDLGNDTQEPAPSMSFDGDLVNNDTEYRVTIDQVDSQIDKDQLRFSGPVQGDRGWDSYGGAQDAQAGDTITIPVDASASGVLPGETLIISYEGDSGSTVLQRLTVPER